MALIQGDFHEAWSWSDELEDKSEQTSDKSATGLETKEAKANGAVDEPLSESAAVSSSLHEGESPEGSDRKKRSKKKRS